MKSENFEFLRKRWPELASLRGFAEAYVYSDPTSALVKHRKALVVQTTGTGKTRVAIALSDLLIRAGCAKRILFLCDRRELRKQAKKAYTDFLPSEPVKTVNSLVSSSANERIFIATYRAMMKVY